MKELQAFAEAALESNGKETGTFTSGSICCTHDLSSRKGIKETIVYYLYDDVDAHRQASGTL